MCSVERNFARKNSRVNAKDYVNNVVSSARTVSDGLAWKCNETERNREISESTQSQLIIVIHRVALDSRGYRAGQKWLGISTRNTNGIIVERYVNGAPYWPGLPRNIRGRHETLVKLN